MQIFINKLKHVDTNINVILAEGLTNEEIKTRLSQYDCLIATSFHAYLVGVKYSVKTLAIAYDPKVEMLAKIIIFLIFQ